MFRSRRFIVLFLLSLLIQEGFSQFAIQVSGRVTDIQNGEPMTGVNVFVPGKNKGTVTNRDGYFYFKIIDEVLPLTIRFSMIGYRIEERTVTQLNESGIRVRLATESYMGEEIIVTAPVVEVEQKTFREVIAVEMIDALGIKETPAANYYEALAYLKGVDVTTQSLQFLTVNARGFNSTENTRFKQVVDGMDNQSPGFNFPIGNIAGIPELDVESLEFKPGPSSAVNGNNSLNGMLEMTSKDPFRYQGLSVVVKPGVADLRPGNDYPFQFFGKGLIDAGVRYAKAFENVAFKLNVSYMKGRDWFANDTSNIRPGSVRYEKDPGHNGLNQYGDEIVEFLPVGEGGEEIPVSRTGYRDKHLVDDGVESLKVGGALHYKLTEKTTAILQGNFGRATTAFTGDNRISLSDFDIFQGKVEVIGEKFMIRGYTTQQNTGEIYDTRFLAINMNRYWKDDARWFRDYENAYTGRLRRFGVIGNDHKVARGFADYQRLVPGTGGFEEVKQGLIDSTNFLTGASLVNNSSLYQVDGQYKIKTNGWFPEIIVGANYTFTDLNSQGTIFPDTAGNDITYYEYGAYAEVSKKFFQEKLQLISSLRFDGSENFNASITPRASMVYTINDIQNVRFSVLTGTRFPGTKEQFILQDLGTSKYVGGLKEMFSQFDLPGNAFYQQDVDAFNLAVENDVYHEDNPIGQTQAILKNMSLLEDGIVQEEQFDGLRPEKVISFELGYKNKIQNSLFFDVIYYRSMYRDFIGFVRVAKPRTSPQIDLFTSAGQVNNSSQRDQILVYRNSGQNVTIQGVALGGKWITPLGGVLAFNATWSDINQVEEDPIVPGFNTPKFKFNLSIANRKMDNMENNPGMKNVGIHINWRYQSAIDWESPFASGRVDPFATTDFQISYNFRRTNAILKAGVSNFLNIKHTSSFGGAQVGIFYYTSFSIDIF